MMYGIYSQEGPRKDLRLQGALLRQDPDRPNNWLAQFDSTYLLEASGWHSFPKCDFASIEGEKQ